MTVGTRLRAALSNAIQQLMRFLFHLCCCCARQPSTDPPPHERQKKNARQYSKDTLENLSSRNSFRISSFALNIDAAENGTENEKIQASTPEYWPYRSASSNESEHKDDAHSAGSKSSTSPENSIANHSSSSKDAAEFSFTSISPKEIPPLVCNESTTSSLASYMGAFQKDMSALNRRSKYTLSVKSITVTHHACESSSTNLQKGLSLDEQINADVGF
jgi:hypothetical protein